MEVSQPLACWQESYGTCAQDVNQAALIEDARYVPTDLEALANEGAVEQAMLDELGRWRGLSSFERQKRPEARNSLRARWVPK